MILCEHGGDDARSVEDLLLFVSQLDGAGIPAKIAAPSFEVPQHPGLQFESAPLLCDPDGTSPQALVVLAAENLSPEKMAGMRQMRLPADLPVIALGDFSRPQTRINTLARLSYVLGRDPDLIDLSEYPATRCGKSYAFGIHTDIASWRRPVVMLLAPDLENGSLANGVQATVLSTDFDTLIVTNGKSKDQWQKRFGFETPVYHYGELPPGDLVTMANICVLMSDVSANPRAKSLLNNFIVSGGAIVNCAASNPVPGDYAVRGPVDPGYLAGFLARTILPNAQQIGATAQTGKTAHDINISRIIQRVPNKNLRPGACSRADRTIFVPTNGVGLGHAQRCSLVAAEITDSAQPVFAAFPSCLPMLNRYGFDVIPLVSRSQTHKYPHANDLVNYLRLSAETQNGGLLVFDGGYVFDSIFRTIARNRLQSVWIRRGLWQAGQNNSIALDREKIFDKVIVPHEAFPELNAAYSYGKHLVAVGPIVQRTDPTQFDRKNLRARLREKFGRDFDNLVVTMLGGGVAADRTAQIQAVCASVAPRKNTLNLIVTWPTARIDPGWFAWENSKVVRTHHASPLVSACDLFISAVGYNSFHEVLYNRIPTIFIPQMASYMDDQRARAESAAKRGAAILVEPEEMLSLNREISACLDGGKTGELRAALNGLDLAQTGNRTAAQIIEEVAHAHH